LLRSATEARVRAVLKIAIDEALAEIEKLAPDRRF
jgi:hypothetical protein